MPRVEYTAKETNIPTDKLVRALITLIVQQFNTLRAFHGLPALTRNQVINAIKQELKNLQ